MLHAAIRERSPLSPLEIRQRLNRPIYTRLKSATFGQESVRVSGGQLEVGGQ